MARKLPASFAMDAQPSSDPRGRGQASAVGSASGFVAEDSAARVVRATTRPDLIDPPEQSAPPEADQRTESRIQDFMSSLHKAKAEWGIFHMLIAQTALRRPILLAQPVEGQNTKTL